jgi:hypothetical protein
LLTTPIPLGKTTSADAIRNPCVYYVDPQVRQWLLAKLLVSTPLVEPPNIPKKTAKKHPACCLVKATFQLQHSVILSTIANIFVSLLPKKKVATLW